MQMKIMQRKWCNWWVCHGVVSGFRGLGWLPLVKRKMGWPAGRSQMKHGGLREELLIRAPLLGGCVHCCHASALVKSVLLVLATYNLLHCLTFCPCVFCW